MPVIESINTIIEISGWLIEYIGLFIVVVSVFFALGRIIMRENSLETIRMMLAEKIILGLEFVIAADILLAAVTTDISDLTRLGGIVFIRVVLGYSLRQEVMNHKHLCPPQKTKKKKRKK